MTDLHDVENDDAQLLNSMTAMTALSLSVGELDALFERLPAGPIPQGTSIGTALIATGSPFSKVLAAIAQVWIWQGKTFDERHRLKNRLTPFGIHLMAANVEQTTSILDGKPCVVLDYSSTPTVAKFIRDEIRQVGPNDYLGMVFINNKKIPLRFWLHFS